MLYTHIMKMHLIWGSSDKGTSLLIRKGDITCALTIGMGLVGMPLQLLVLYLWKFSHFSYCLFRTNTRKCMMRITRSIRVNWTSSTVNTLMPKNCLNGTYMLCCICVYNCHPLLYSKKSSQAKRYVYCYICVVHVFHNLSY